MMAEGIQHHSLLGQKLMKKVMLTIISICLLYIHLTILSPPSWPNAFPGYLTAKFLSHPPAPRTLHNCVFSNGIIFLREFQLHVTPLIIILYILISHSVQLILPPKCISSFFLLHSHWHCLMAHEMMVTASYPVPAPAPLPSSHCSASSLLSLYSHILVPLHLLLLLPGTSLPSLSLFVYFSFRKIYNIFTRLLALMSPGHNFIQFLQIGFIQYTQNTFKNAFMKPQLI